jgi:hypothetical protein
MGSQTNGHGAAMVRLLNFAICQCLDGVSYPPNPIQFLLAGLLSHRVIVRAPAALSFILFGGTKNILLPCYAM